MALPTKRHLMVSLKKFNCQKIFINSRKISTFFFYNIYMSSHVNENPWPSNDTKCL